MADPKMPSPENFNYGTGRLVWQIKRDNYETPAPPGGEVISLSVKMETNSKEHYTAALVPEGTRWGDEEGGVEILESTGGWGSMDIGNPMRDPARFDGYENNKAVKDFYAWQKRQQDEDDRKWGNKK